MPSGPTLFGDDEFEPTSDAASPDESSSDERPPHRPPRRPNYLVRRGVVVGGVVAVMATAAIVIGNLIGTGATSSVSGALDAEWNRVVQIDERLGRVIVQNDQGEELERIDSGIRDVTSSAVVGLRAVLTGADAVAVIDLADVTVSTADFGGDIARPSGSALTVVAGDAGGSRALLVHAPTGEQVDTNEFAPIPGTRYEFDTARSTPSGRDVLVTDSGNFQSVLFSFDRDEPSFFPGLALAVGDDVVVTAQNVGAEATVNVFDHDGESVSSGRTASVRAAIVDGDAVRLVTVDGRIVDMDIGSGDTEDGERLDIGTITDGHVWPSGDRLIVVGADGTAVVADDGDVLTSIAETVPADEAALVRATCLVVQSTSDEADIRSTIVDVTDGSVVAEGDVDGSVFGSTDGCTTVTVSTAGAELLDASGATDLGARDVVMLSPDAAALVEDLEGRAILVPIATGDDDRDTAGDDGADVDGTDLGPAGRIVAFTEL